MTIFHASKEYTCSYLVVVKCTLAPTSRDKNKQIEVACGMFAFFWGDSLFFVQELTFSKMEDSNSPLCLFGQNLVFWPNGCSKLYTQAYYAASVEWACAKVWKKNVYVTDKIVRTGALNLVLGVLFSKLALKCCNSLISISLKKREEKNCVVDEIFALKLVPWIVLKSCLVNYLVVKCCMFLFSCYLCKWHAKCKELFNRNLELLTQCTLIIILSRSLLFELDSE